MVSVVAVPQVRNTAQSEPHASRASVVGGQSATVAKIGGTAAIYRTAAPLQLHYTSWSLMRLQCSAHCTLLSSVRPNRTYLNILVISCRHYMADIDINRLRVLSSTHLARYLERLMPLCGWTGNEIIMIVRKTGFYADKYLIIVHSLFRFLDICHYCKQTITQKYNNFKNY